MANAANFKTYISLNKQQCITQPSLINLLLNEYLQWLSYYSFEVNWDWCMGSYNSKKTEDLKFCVFNMITGIR